MFDEEFGKLKLVRTADRAPHRGLDPEISYQILVNDSLGSFDIREKNSEKDKKTKTLKSKFTQLLKKCRKF